MEIELHAFLISVVGGGQWPVASFTPRPARRSGEQRQERNLFLLLEIKT
jgi:hypothetical protein